MITCLCSTPRIEKTSELMFTVGRDEYFSATHDSTAQHAATRCNTLQHCDRKAGRTQQLTATHYNMLQHAATRFDLLAGCIEQLTAAHYNTLQHAATRCNTQ